MNTVSQKNAEALYEMISLSRKNERTAAVNDLITYSPELINELVITARGYARTLDRYKRITKKALIDAGYYCNINVNGNAKLINSLEKCFFIWNVPTVITCPGATVECIKKCYARARERVYRTVYESRRKNLVKSINDINFIVSMILTIEYYLNSNKFKNIPEIEMRMHESGDMYSLKYTAAWHTIARYFKDNKQIIFNTYTKSYNYNEICKAAFNLDNITVRYSVWADTEKTIKNAMEKTGVIYTAYDRKTIDYLAKSGVKFHECRCSDCGSCKKCQDKTEKLIICEIH